MLQYLEWDNTWPNSRYSSNRLRNQTPAAGWCSFWEAEFQLWRPMHWLCVLSLLELAWCRTGVDNLRHSYQMWHVDWFSVVCWVNGDEICKIVQNFWILLKKCWLSSSKRPPTSTQPLHPRQLCGNCWAPILWGWVNPGHCLDRLGH